MIPFRVLESIDRSMLHERARARSKGPNAWLDALREEAVSTMIRATGASRDDVERDLDAYIAASPEDTTTTLEQIVYQQRFLRRAERPAEEVS